MSLSSLFTGMLSAHKAPGGKGEGGIDCLLPWICRRSNKKKNQSRSSKSTSSVCWTPHQ